MTDAWQPNFAFAVCQYGAEAALKQDVGKRMPNWRPAFSRPGFVTFKLDMPVAAPENAPDPSLFARTSGWSLGRVSGEQLNKLAAAVWNLEQVVAFLDARRIVDFHVWQRDRSRPGEDGFEPGPTALAAEVEQALRTAAPSAILESLLQPKPTITPRNRWVLDVAVIEPGEWWIGCHRTTSRASCWPGGVPPLSLPDHAVGRAYLKMAEALQWSALPVSHGDCIVELGCAPGGAAQALLERGLQVLGVDPAEMPPELLEHPQFKHLRMRSADVRRNLFQDVKWLAADMNVAPAFTLDAVEAIVSHRGNHVRGLILTLKLPEWGLIDELPNWIRRVQSWGYRDVRLRQLAFNRQEICLVALRSRGQRRLRRSTKRQTVKPKQRRDASHANKPAPHIELPSGETENGSMQDENASLESPRGERRRHSRLTFISQSSEEPVFNSKFASSDPSAGTSNVKRLR